jgi:hypothetical protein
VTDSERCQLHEHRIVAVERQLSELQETVIKLREGQAVTSTLLAQGQRVTELVQQLREKQATTAAKLVIVAGFVSCAVGALVAAASRALF